MDQGKILIVGGYGEVGRRLGSQIEATQPGRVIVAGRRPERARRFPARKIDVDDAASIELALEGIGVVVACIRQREPHLLRAAVRRGIGYTSIAPPRLPWSVLDPLHAEAQRTGARIVLATGLSPGITSVLVRDAANRLGKVDTVETAVMLSLGDVYGSDSMAFIFEEVSHPYTVMVDGKEQTWNAFERSKRITFPTPIGERRAYSMPFTDQFYYPATIGAKTAIARIALDPPWLAGVLAMLLRAGLKRALRRGRAGGVIHELVEKLRGRYVGRNHYGVVVEVSGRGRTIRSSVVGREQATATAAGAGAITEALWGGEVAEPGVWLAEQVIPPDVFFARLATHGIVVETTGVLMSSAPPARNNAEIRASAPRSAPHA